MIGAEWGSAERARRSARMPAMRRTLRWALPLLVALLALAPAAPASAASPTLTVTPQSQERGQSVTLEYSLNVSGYSCSPDYPDRVSFSIDGHQPFAVQALTQSCTAGAQYSVPLTASCGSHDFLARFKDANGTDHPEWSATHKLTVKCVVVPTVTLSPRPSRTPSPTASATASPTPSPTASATPTATPSATPTPTFASSSPQPVIAVEPPDIPGPSGSSKAPWYGGGIAVGVLALAGAWFLVRPRAGTPVAAGVAVAGLAATAGLFAFAPSDPPVPVILGSYPIGDGEGCANGDIPVAGGFYSLDIPAGLLRFQPRGSSSESGYWETSVSGTGHQSAVCLRLGTKVVWRVRSRTLSPTAPSGAVSCQTPESLLGGGFAFPWGLAALSSYPQAPMRWAAANGPYTDGPAPEGEVSALCAELPEGLRTYVTTASGSGTVDAYCFKGDHPLGGGYAGRAVDGSYPNADGWTVTASGTASAYALCYHPSRRLGLRTSYPVQSLDGDAVCGSGDVLLGGGWQSGTTLDGLQHFEPNGSGWKAEQPSGGPTTAYALCAKRW
jgi:hypothetical protein